MKKLNTTDRIQDLIEKINVVKNCIKENTDKFSLDTVSDLLTFQAKENIKIQIKLYK